MATSESLKGEYGKVAADYNNYYSKASPMARLEVELFTSALGHPEGAVILDLGGGSGLKARQALDAGAKSVDVVDFSREMMRELVVPRSLCLYSFQRVFDGRAILYSFYPCKLPNLITPKL